MPGRQSVVVERELEDTVLRTVRKQLREKRLQKNRVRQDIITWSEQHFYVSETEAPIIWEPFQKAVLKCAFDRLQPEDVRIRLFPSLADRVGKFPFRLAVVSAIKKSGKTTIGAVVARWIAEEQTRFGEISTMGNDLRQAKERSFQKIADSIRLTPGYRHRGLDGYLPDRWLVQGTKLTCTSSGSKIEAVSVDARGEAGANPDLTVWCVSEDTEALTRKGFKLVKDLTSEDSVATLNSETGFMEWQSPRTVNVKSYNGKMLQMRHRRASFIVTPNHRIWGKFFTNSRYAGKNGILHKRKPHLDGWRFEEASAAAKYAGGEIKATADWQGEAYVDPLYARLLGYYVAEGYAHNGYIIIYQDANNPVYEDIYKTAEALGYSPSRDERSISIRNSELYEKWKPLGRSWEKYVPDEVKNSQSEALWAFFLAYMLGDGWGDGNTLEDRLPDGGQCSTVSQQLSDDLIEIALKIGYIPRLMSAKQGPCRCPTCKRLGREKMGRKSYRLSFSKASIIWERNWGGDKDSQCWKEIDYEGIVSCPSIPNGIFYIRHEGKCCWTGNTELWGFEDPAAVKFFHEMTPPPTKADSIRLIETYAGFDGESLLLKSQYDLGLAGRQLTAGELAEITGVEIGCFQESSKPDDPVPIWINEGAGLFMYWDSGLQARRMQWQRGEEGARYYAEEEQKLPPPTFHRIHMNEWVGGEGDFIPMGAWDKCYDPNLSFFEPGDKTPAVLAVDAATTGDCFGVVLVTRHPDPKRHNDPAIRACRKWDPKERGGKIDYEEPEAFIRTLLHGGCIRGHPQYPPFRKPAEECDHASRARACEKCCEACAAGQLVLPYNIIEVAYDPYQLESMMGRMYKESINCQPFSQQRDRMIADSMLYDVIINGQLAHNAQNGDQLREHIINCGSRQAKEEDTKLRIVKKSADRKIDLAVATSMGTRRCLYLLI